MKNLIVILPAVLLFVTLSVHAEEPENYIKYRQAMMKAIGGHSGAASQIVRGKVAPDGDLAIHASALAELSTNLTRLFPPGSDFGETRAKIEIWDNWEQFEKAADQAKTTTAAFAAAVALGDADRIGTTFKDVGEACKGCHKEFREKDD